MIVYDLSRRVGNLLDSDHTFRNQKYSLFLAVVSSKVLLLWGHAWHWEAHLSKVDWHHSWHCSTRVGRLSSISLSTSLHQHLLLNDLLLEHRNLLLLVHHDGLADQVLLVWRKLRHIWCCHAGLRSSWHSTHGSSCHHGV